jgi:hypothetical protein
MEYSKIKLTPLLDTLYLGKLEDAIYFSPKYSNYISNSRLGLLKKEGEEAFLKGFVNQGFNQSFFTGSLVHELCLQSDLFELAPDLMKPSAKLGAMADHLYPSFLANNIVPDEDIYQASDVVNYYKGKMNEDKCSFVRGNCVDYWKARKQFESTYNTNKTVEYADSKLIETVLGCTQALSDNKLVQDLLHPKNSFGLDIISENEQAVLLDIQVDIEGEDSFIVHLKAKIDNYTIDKEANIITVNDVKTCSRDTRMFNEVIDMYSYNRELAWYAMLLNLCCEKYYNMHNPIVKGNFLVVSTSHPYYSSVHTMNKKLFMDGIQDYKHLLKQACSCLYYESKK